MISFIFGVVCTIVVEAAILFVWIWWEDHPWWQKRDWVRRLWRW